MLGLDIRMMPLQCLEFGEANLRKLWVLASLKLPPY